MRVTLPSSLAGHFLIAMPSLADTPFSRGVALLCQHDEDGAVGLLVNSCPNIAWATSSPR
jgi:putative transcriptional regulator